MSIKTSKDLLKTIRSMDHLQLNPTYRKEYITDLKNHIRMAKARNKAGVRGFTKTEVKRLESELRNLDKKWPFIEKIEVEIG